MKKSEYKQKIKELEDRLSGLEVKEKLKQSVDSGEILLYLPSYTPSLEDGIKVEIDCSALSCCKNYSIVVIEHEVKAKVSGTAKGGMFKVSDKYFDLSKENPFYDGEK